MKLETLKNLQFLSPGLTAKINHFSKDDTKHIKNILNNRLGSASFIISIVLALISVAIFLFLQIDSGWKQAEVYGISSVLGDAGCFSMCLSAIVLKLISLKAKKDKTVTILNRLAIDFLYVGIATLMFGSFYADAEKGFLSKSPTISVGIVVIAFLLVVQPIFLLDSLILNLSTITTMFVLSIYAKEHFKIQSFIYYILIVLVFIVMSRLFISTMFYAESQKYIQEAISKSLLDTVMYDELTHCKNRYALKKYLEEKVPLWKQKKTSLLITMFDIDNFKEYNDYFSHQVGDGCLKEIANAVKKRFPSPRLEFYRYGGEEFLLFFELEDEEEAKQILESLRISAFELNIESPPGSPSKYLTISVGGYLLETDEGFDFDFALNEADTNLYKAKGDGKNVCYLNNQKIAN